jgi:hypothetical protein
MIQTSFTLGDLLRLLVAKLTDKSINLPLQDDRLWQRVFYSLKKEFGSKFEVLAKLRFDSDGPSPRSKELADYIHALHWTGNTSGFNPSWETMTLPPDIAADWLQELETMEPEVKELVDIAFTKAKSAFAS